MSEREFEALLSAPASTLMECFHLTEQTEKDCVLLMRGEVFVDNFVNKILTRPENAV